MKASEGFHEGEFLQDDNESSTNDARKNALGVAFIVFVFVFTIALLAVLLL